MRIIQITDLHIGEPGEDTYGIDVRANFENILQKSKVLEPDHLIITGDFCFRDPKLSIYQWVQPQLEAIGIPYQVISGNHDDPLCLAKVFKIEKQLSGKEIYYQKHWGEWPVFFLDTTTAQISAQQLAWLENALVQVNHEVIIFMHHPPLLANVPYMDQAHEMKEVAALQKVLDRFAYGVNIFTGHYHVDKIIRRRHLMVYITPACFFQINQYEQDFKRDHQRIGLRMIELRGPDLLTSVHYYDGALLK